MIRGRSGRGRGGRVISCFAVSIDVFFMARTFAQALVAEAFGGTRRGG